MGKTDDLDRRWRDHQRDARRGCDYAFHRAMRKNKWDDENKTRHDVSHYYFTFPTEEEALAEEERLIVVLKTHIKKGKRGYNMTDGGDGTSGYEWTDEQKERLSASCLGRKDSDETREKKRVAMLGEKNHQFGKSPSKATRKKISVARLGMKDSDETREKKRVAMLGEKNHMFGKSPSKESREKNRLSQYARYAANPDSAETRAKKSASHRGEKNINFGKPRSAKDRASISLGKRMANARRRAERNMQLF